MHVYDSNMKSDKAAPVVLVVDDDDALRRLLLDYLLMTKFPCKGAANASEALAILCQENIDLVVSDIRMPGKDGMELMQEARREFPNIPFIIMTGYSSEYSYDGIIDAGASDFIVKPFSLDELKAKIFRIQKR